MDLQIFLRRYIEVILRCRWLVLAATALITALLIYQAKNLEMIIDPDTMLPQTHPFVATTNKVEKIFGGRYIVVIGITPKQGDIFQPAVLNKVQAITAKLLETPTVVRENLLSLSARRAKDIAGNAEGMAVQPLMSVVPETPEQMQALRLAVARNTAYHDSIVSKDLKTTAVIAEFRNPKGGFRSLDALVQPVVDSQRDESVDIAVGGLPGYLAWIERYSDRIVILFPLAVLIVGLIHWEAFRTWQGLILPLVTPLLAVTWALGVMGWQRIPLDIFNGFTPILILAVGAGHAVQLLKRYYEEYHHLRQNTQLTPREANRQAVVEAITHIGPVMLTAGMVAALGFFSLIIFEISSIRVFGIFTGIGIVGTLILEMTFIPALRSMLPAPGAKEQQLESQARFWDRITDGFANLLVGEKRRYIYYGAAAFVLLALAGASRVVIESTTKSLFDANHPVQRDDKLLNGRLAGTNNIFVLVEGVEQDSIKDPAVLKAMDALQAELANHPEIGKTVSLVDFLKRMNQAMNGDDPAFYKVPDSRELVSQYLLLYSMSGEPGDFDSYVDYDYKAANITAFIKTDSNIVGDDIVAQVRRFEKEHFPKSVSVNLGGSVPQGAALTTVIVNDKVLNIVQIAAVVFLISSIVFRSLWAGVLVLTPLLLAVLVNFGVMGLTGIRLNIPTSMVSAMAVGIGADYAIYLLYRLREELARGLDEASAVRKVLNTAGKASLFVASAVAGGYGVLFFSPGFYPHTWTATLICSAMLVSVIAALTLLPALVLKFRPRFIFNGGSSMKVTAPARAAVIATLALIVAHAPTPSHAQGNAVEIMEKNFVAAKVQDSISDATFVLTNKSGQERTRKTFGTTKLQANGIDNMRMTRFLAPSDVKGTVSLLIEHAEKDDDMWIYLPALKKVRRLVANNKRESFVGTDFSYGDVIGHKVAEWEHKLLREEDCDGGKCYVIESTPKNASVKSNSGYSKRIGWIHKASFVTVKGEGYDEAGQLLKKFAFRNWKLADADKGRYQAEQLEAQNMQTGHRTVIKVENLKVNQDIKDDYFTQRYMEQP